MVQITGDYMDIMKGIMVSIIMFVLYDEYIHHIMYSSGHILYYFVPMM